MPSALQQCLTLPFLLFGKIMIVVAWIFEHYGRFVGRYPYPFLILPLLFTGVLATGALWITVDDDLRFLYSPGNAPSRHEYAIHKGFTGEGTQSTYCALALEAFNGSKLNSEPNVLESREQTEAIYQINDYVMRNLTFELGDRVYNFGTDVCPRIAFCPDSNRIVEKFLATYWSDELQEDPRVSLTYPVMEFFHNRFFLPAHLYGVTTDKVGKVLSVSMVHLMYQIPGTDIDTAESVADAFEKSLISYLEREPPHGLNISMFSLRILKREVARNTTVTFPFVSVTIALIVAFTVASCMTSDWVTSKPFEGLFGVTSSALAIISAAGLMFWFEVPFITQVIVMPFLALAIGVDDTYIILGAWQCTDRRQPPEERLAEALKEAGSAITVTSLTDCLSFGIGAFSSTPAISIFCKYVAASIMFDYIYQLTFFSAVVALGGRREDRGHHSIFLWQRVDEKMLAVTKSEGYICPMQRLFSQYYAPILCKAPTRIIVLISYCCYLGVALYGCTKLTPNLTPNSLVVDDSPLKHYINLAESHIWSEGLMGRVYVDKAPDFSQNMSVVSDFMEFVTELENTKFSMGKQSTQLWLREFLDYWQYFSSQDSNFYRDLRGYLGVSFNNQWGPYLKWAVNPNRPSQDFVQRFYFTTGFQIKDWTDRTAMLVEWRRICAKYPQYEALVYDEQNFYGDQVLALPNTTLSLLGITVIAITIICIAFISDPIIVFWVVFTMLSMDIGIAGFLSLWGADLSPTTVVNILMSIGLSVDFATHVGYRIYRTEQQDLDAKISEALGAIAWPVLQGGISTFLAIVIMLCVKSYVVRVFAHTCILVVVFGLFHGLVLLPVILRCVGTNTLRLRSELGAKTRQLC